MRLRLIFKCLTKLCSSFDGNQTTAHFLNKHKVHPVYQVYHVPQSTHLAREPPPPHWWAGGSAGSTHDSGHMKIQL